MIIVWQRARQQVIGQVQDRQIQSSPPRRQWARQLVVRQIQHGQRPQVVKGRDLAPKLVPVQQQSLEPHKAVQIPRDQPLHRVVGQIQLSQVHHLVPPRDWEPARDPQGIQFELTKFGETHKVFEKDGRRWDIGLWVGVGGDIGELGAVGTGPEVEGEQGDRVVGGEEVLANGEGV